MQKSRRSVTDLYLKMLMGAERNSCCSLQKRFRQFVVLAIGRSFCSSVGLHCASLLAHSLPQPNAPSSAFIAFLPDTTSSHARSAATGWLLPSVYKQMKLVLQSPQSTWCAQSR